MPARVTSRVPLFAALLVVIVGLLLAFTYVTMAAQHAIGIYAQGQARWMQSHTRAVMYLHRMARTGNLAIHDSLQEAMRIPRAYEQARMHLLPGRVDREAAIRAFMDGELTRKDAERAATFGRLLRTVRPAERVLASWSAGDVYFDSLEVLADEMRSLLERGDREAAMAMVPRVAAADGGLVALEREFSDALAETARLMPPLLLGVGAIFGIVLIVFGVATTYGVARAADRSRDALHDRELQLQHAQKLEAVGRLAGGVAHEFNNILTAITVNLELAIMALPEGDEARLDLDAALTAARRASRVTRQLLVFARPDPIDARLVDVSKTLRELDVILTRLAGEQVTVTIAHRAEAPVVMADPGQLQQILLNLVSNARDAMPDGGTVHIEVANAHADQLAQRRRLVVAGAPPDDADVDEWVTLAVRDSGSGMTRETVDRLFEPFFTTKPPGVGTGLGLPVVSGIVSRLGGRIYLDTAPGAGSEFLLALPRAAHADGARAEEGAIPTSTAEMRLPRGGTVGRRRDDVVLLVEDETPVRNATKRMLESAGYHVREAKHAEDALLQWARQPAHIVVTDFMMPGMNGAELIARLREQRPELPAVIVSGYTGGGAIDEASLGRRTVLLQKPFSREDLLASMEELVAESA